jgi:hypothetical protein
MYRVEFEPTTSVLDGGSARHKAATHKAGTYTEGSTDTEQTQTSLPRVGIEPTTPVLEREKTVQALDSAATVIGMRFRRD